MSGTVLCVTNSVWFGRCCTILIAFLKSQKHSEWPGYLTFAKDHSCENLANVIAQLEMEVRGWGNGHPLSTYYVPDSHSHNSEQLLCTDYRGGNKPREMKYFAWTMNAVLLRPRLLPRCSFVPLER